MWTLSGTMLPKATRIRPTSARIGPKLARPWSRSVQFWSASGRIYPDRRRYCTNLVDTGPSLVGIHRIRSKSIQRCPKWSYVGRNRTRLGQFQAKSPPGNVPPPHAFHQASGTILARYGASARAKYTDGPHEVNAGGGGGARISLTPKGSRNKNMTRVGLSGLGSGPSNPASSHQESPVRPTSKSELCDT